MPLSALLALGAIATSASAACVASWRRDRPGVYLFKPLTTVLVIVATLWLFAPALPRYQDVVLLGLTLSLAGDVFLMLPRDRFVAGLASFLAAQAVYVWAFSLDVTYTGVQLLWLVPFAFFALMLVVYLWRGMPGAALKGAVITYAFVMCLMAWRAVVRTDAPEIPRASVVTASAGALLFLLSDAILAIDRFRHRIPAAEPVVFATYWAAQALIALSVRA